MNQPFFLLLVCGLLFVSGSKKKDIAESVVYPAFNPEEYIGYEIQSPNNNSGLQEDYLSYVIHFNAGGTSTRYSINGYLPIQWNYDGKRNILTINWPDNTSGVPSHKTSYYLDKDQLADVNNEQPPIKILKAPSVNELKGNLLQGYFYTYNDKNKPGIIHSYIFYTGNTYGFVPVEGPYTITYLSPADFYRHEPPRNSIGLFLNGKLFMTEQYNGITYYGILTVQ